MPLELPTDAEFAKFPGLGAHVVDLLFQPDGDTEFLTRDGLGLVEHR